MRYCLAVTIVRAGRRVRRAGWRHSGKYLEQSSCADFNWVTHSPGPGENIYQPWIPGDEDAFAEDWEEVPCDEPD